jgi:hypothetical protein
MTPRQIGLLVLLSALWGSMFLLVKYNSPRPVWALRICRRFKPLSGDWLGGPGDVDLCPQKTV